MVNYDTNLWYARDYAQSPPFLIGQCPKAQYQYQGKALIAITANLNRILTQIASYYRGSSTGPMQRKLFLPSKNTRGCRELWKVRIFNTHRHTHTQFKSPSLQQQGEGRRFQQPQQNHQKALEPEENVKNPVKVLTRLNALTFNFLAP